MNCEHTQCQGGAPATWRMYWPGRASAIHVCEAHADKAREIAKAMGFELAIEPFGFGVLEHDQVQAEPPELDRDTAATLVDLVEGVLGGCLHPQTEPEHPSTSSALWCTDCGAVRMLHLNGTRGEWIAPAWGRLLRSELVGD